ncbi:MAG: hypothetical protein K0R54_167 [Clostridiaceae bacterium]|jgi:hypothetical protein|nr:hypothetical protein [Clostridiaceae bacterium]
MKYLTTIKDTMLNKDYDLYEINAKILEKLIKNTYKLSEVRLQTFNDSLKLFEYVSKLKGMKDGIEYVYRDNYVPELKKNIKREISSIKKNIHISDKNNISGELGYELMPVVVSVKDRNISNPDCKIELIDGFRRFFFVNEVPDKNILVKVYDTLSDAEWINSMIVFNSWKFANYKYDSWSRPLLSKNMIDRGFRLGLYMRYKIDFINLNSYTRHDIWKLLDLYFESKPYMTLWNNDQFYNDLLVMNQIENYKPIFKYIKGKKNPKEDIYDTSIVKHDQPEFIENMYCRYIKILGSIRREEFEKEKSGQIVTRKPFSLKEYAEFLKTEDLQQHFVKMSGMSVPGHVDNYVEKHIINDMKNYLKNVY